MQKWAKLYLIALVMLGFVSSALAIEVPQAEWERMKQRMADMESRGASVPSTTSMVDVAMDSHYGPCANVTTKAGKLTVGGLLQVWYYTIQQQGSGFFMDPNVNGIVDVIRPQTHNGFRIRRSELKFNVDINENISGTIMIDPAREAAGFPHFPSNLGNDKKQNFVSPEFNDANGPAGAVNTATIAAVQNGAFKSGPPSLLQDAYINWHGCIPSHDIQIGQFRPWCGEEGIRNSGELDFVERSMVGFQSESRDLGISIHGSFWDCGCDGAKGNGRFQYWAGVFDGAGSFFDPGQQQNRPDTNDYKDLNLRMLVRPMWGDCLGWLELGGSILAGRHGQGHVADAIGTPYPDLNRPVGWAERANAWLSYKAPGFARGLWIRGEWIRVEDREAVNSVIDVASAGTGTNGQQGIGLPFTKYGNYGAIGWKFGDMRCGAPCWLKPVELLVRYDQFQNIETANEVRPERTDRFYTKVKTFGMNYYIAGHNAKVQANYNVVDLPNESSSPTRVFHTVHNDSFVINFQVMF